MAALPALAPSQDFQRELRRRGGATADRCYQCATCSSVCELAPADAPFPRRIMLWTQWGLADRLAADPAVWLCHQCNDCTLRCPRDSRPGDVLSTVRSLLIERLAFPGFLGRLVANAATTWPLLLAAPVLFWALLLGVTGHLTLPDGLRPGFAYEELVPHSLIYAVFFPVAAFVLAAAGVGARRLWNLLGGAGARSGSFLGGIGPALFDIATHRRFGSCTAAQPRRTGHLLVLWGFVGAAVTSGLLVVGIYIQKLPMPLALAHPYKLLGNASAALLVVGILLVIANRLGDAKRAGSMRGFDTYFLAVVTLVIVTGVLAEVGRLALTPSLALPIYVVHLGVVLNLFITFPYSKFAHLLYRSIAMVHERLTQPAAGRT